MMTPKTTVSSSRVLAVAVALAIVLPSAALAWTAGRGATQHDHGKSKPGSSHVMHDQMMAGMKKMTSMKMSGDVDRDFAMMMIDHHKAALDMAEIEIRDGKDEKIKAMARNILDSQKAEIQEFEKWLASKGHSMKD